MLMPSHRSQHWQVTCNKRRLYSPTFRTFKAPNMGRFLELVTSPCLPVLVSVFLMFMSVVGTIKVFGILFEDMSISLGTTVTEFGLWIGVFSLLFSFPAPFVLIAYRKLKCPQRHPLLLGAFMVSLGFILASMATSTWHVTTCLAITALGLCTLQAYLTMRLMEELTDNFNLLYLLASSGCAVGMVLPPLVAELLHAPYGWRGALLNLGALQANTIPCIMCIKPRGNNVGPTKNAGKIIRCTANRHHGMDETNDTEMRCRESSRAKSGTNSDGEPLTNRREDRNIIFMSKDEGWSGGDRCSNHGGDTISVNLDFSRKDAIRESEAFDGAGSSYPFNNGVDCQNEYYVDTSSDHYFGTWIKETIPVKENEMVQSIQNCVEKCSDIVHAFRSTPFCTDAWSNLVYVCAIVFGIVFTGWHAFLVPHALQRGISPYYVLIITTFAAIGNFSGRVLAGILTNKLVSPTSLFILLCPIDSLLLLGYAYVSNEIAMSAMAGASAATITARVMLPLLITKGRTTMDKYHWVFGAIEMNWGIGLLLGGYCSGLVVDKFSSYDAAFKLLAAVEVGVFFLMLPLRFVRSPHRATASPICEMRTLKR